ncbi:MAG: IPExxxVDY family protein [Bacteroidota bacterium]
MVKKLSSEPYSAEEFHILGIATQLRDYRLCHQINKTLYLDLEKIDDLSAELSDEKTLGYFSIYRFQKPENYIDFFLIANKSPDGILLPDLRQADFFLVIHGPFSKESQDRFIKTAKTIPGVLAAFRIEITKQKKIDNFLGELEMHMIAYESKGKGKQNVPLKHDRFSKQTD